MPTASAPKTLLFKFFPRREGDAPAPSACGSSLLPCIISERSFPLQPLPPFCTSGLPSFFTSLLSISLLPLPFFPFVPAACVVHICWLFYPCLSCVPSSSPQQDILPCVGFARASVLGVFPYARFSHHACSFERPPCTPLVSSRLWTRHNSDPGQWTRLKGCKNHWVTWVPQALPRVPPLPPLLVPLCMGRRTRRAASRRRCLGRRRREAGGELQLRCLLSQQACGQQGLWGAAPGGARGIKVHDCGAGDSLHHSGQGSWIGAQAPAPPRPSPAGARLWHPCQPVLNRAIKPAPAARPRRHPPAWPA